MAKTNITLYSSTPSENTDIDDINIDELCPASNLNNALRSLLSHLKNIDTGSQALTALSVTGDTTISSGNLLVGTTDNQLFDNTSGSGLCYRPSLSLDIARESTSSTSTAILLNNTGVDSRYITFRKDGVDVGSIGVNTDRIYLAGANEGVAIDDDLNAFIPTEENGGARDNASDLGSSGARWRNIYLGGGVYLGGTGSANKLDDYEEGTFTATLYGSTTGTGTSVTTTGNYVKVGKVVTIGAYFQNMNLSSMSGSTLIGGLPFASSTITTNCNTGSVALHGFSFNGFVTPFILNGGTVLDILDSISGAAWAGLSIPASTGKYLMVEITYKTS